MRQPQFIRSNTFRWASAVAGVFAVFIIVLFGFIYWQIDDYLIARSDRMIATQIGYIAGLAAASACSRRSTIICGRIPAAFNLPGCSAPTGTGSRAIWSACRPDLRSMRRCRACR